MANLYLLPSFLAPDGKTHIPSVARDRTKDLRIFVVERIRSARRYIKAIHPDFPINDALFIELDKHNLASSLRAVKSALEENQDIGLMSEAGTPCIADPGAQVVNMARSAGYIIKPLTGPSSIILGLMASGMNGQKFTFHGYLPIKEAELNSKLRELSVKILKDKSTQIFIETPYRNNKILERIIKTVDNRIYLSVSTNLTSSEENITTKPISKWSVGALAKIPAIFCLGQLEK